MPLTFKPIPEPPHGSADALESIATVRATLPATEAEAADTPDCCARVLDRTDGVEGAQIRDRDDAATWLTFLRALELAVDGTEGYRRTEQKLELAAIQMAFRERVHGAQTVLDVLDAAAKPLSAATVAERVDAASRRPVERERVGRVLEWAVRLELAEQVASEDEHRYRATAVGP
ncbi:uncharacterized protein Nmag_0204 [Natrialba magadii ATCC 43099]|uniref:Uncharacterized protein n=1 Tax=Natrialba magadii (strain ATCC 43099 / DSM 3394 / CCM 3739 / CIP 104546 / IAM 13178 / JCM 8861 / NBRC 102185 / NCIMB 2190 / MS3) TaxID=547559 RepID=D3SWK4_NATMM|nr:hypothetical protein [Natrialba magadii]ADD03796.1 uncharacterized protein Nmag_0204 [Natrialba magadii ATCC 43099]ELY33850.1 hypothetical protein C500_01463 [Natrialba magadii ATCC 43099]